MSFEFARETPNVGYTLLIAHPDTVSFPGHFQSPWLKILSKVTFFDEKKKKNLKVQNRRCENRAVPLCRDI